MEVDELIDRLYALPPEQFTQARDEAARELRRGGHRDEADRVKALRRPSVEAAAVNRLVREHRDDVDAFLRAAGALREAQLAGKGDVGSATRREREALERLIAAGGDAVRRSLEAAAVDDAAAQALLEGRLERGIEPAGFGTLAAHAAGRRPAEARSAARKRAGDQAAREQVRAAKAAAEAAAADARAARRALQAAEQRLERAHKALDAAERAARRQSR
jgi:hypothetical protein